MSDAVEQNSRRSCIDLHSFALAQIEQIEKYRKSLAIMIGADPAAKLSVNDIADQWIQLHSAQFRKHWDESVKISS